MCGKSGYADDYGNVGGNRKSVGGKSGSIGTREAR